MLICSTKKGRKDREAIISQGFCCYPVLQVERAAKNNSYLKTEELSISLKGDVELNIRKSSVTGYLIEFLEYIRLQKGNRISVISKIYVNHLI